MARYLILNTLDVIENIIELDDPTKYTVAATKRLVAYVSGEARIGLKQGETPVVVAPSPDTLAARATDYISQLEFDILFNQESRLRVLEAKPAITKVQYRDALIARWKVLNP